MENLVSEQELQIQISLTIQEMEAKNSGIDDIIEEIHTSLKENVKSK